MSRDYVIVTDSCSDLSKELRESNSIRYCRMGIVKKSKDGDKEIPASLDWDLYTNKELNDWQRDGVEMKTTQVSRVEFEEVFKSILDEGKDIIYVACSSALSGSFNLSTVIRDELKETYPEASIYCVDSLCSSLGEGKMVLDAAKLQQEGKSAVEVVAFLERDKLCYNQFATVETLDYLKKAGRVKASSAFFGNLFGVKPIIISDAKGANVALKKVKGRKGSLNEIVAMAKENIEDKNQTVYIVHADCLADAEFLKDLVEKEINPAAVSIEYLGPIVGVSTGPGTISIYAKGKKVEFVGE